MDSIRKRWISLLTEKPIEKSEIVLLLCSLCICFFVVYFPFIFGDYTYGYNASDWGADTFQQYIPFYVDLINSIRDGSFSWWNFNFGLGASYFISQTWLFDPFNIILIAGCLLFGDVALPAMLLLALALKIAIAAFVFNLYLSFFVKKPLARIVGSIFYCMSGFMVLWGSHYWFANTLVFLALILLCLEMNLEKRSYTRTALLIVVVALTLIWSIYISFKILVFSVLYVIFRLCMKGEGNRASRVKAFIHLAIPVIIGILLSCIVVIPAACVLLFDSTRIAQGAGLLDLILQDLTSFLSLDSVFVELTRVMGNSLYGTLGVDLPGIYKNYYEAIQIGLGCSIYVFVFIFLFGIAKYGAKREKIGSLIIAILMILYLINYFLPALFDVFAGYPPSKRSSFLLIPIICLMVSISLDRYIIPKRISYISLFIGLTFSLVILVIAFEYANGRGQKLCLIFFVSVILFTITLYFFQAKSKSVFLIVAVCIAIGSLVIDDYVTVNYRNRLETAQFPSASVSQKGSNTEQLLMKYDSQDNEVYRIEKDYIDYVEYLDSFVQNYNGVTSYNSALFGGVQSFYRMFCPSIFRIENHPTYVAFSQVEDPEEVATFLGVKYFFSKEPLECSWLEQIDLEDNIYVYKNKNLLSFASIYHSFIAEEELAELDIEERNELLSNTLTIPNDLVQEWKLTGGESLGDSKEQVDVYRVNDSVFKMQYSVDKEGVLAIPIPNTSGWSATLDGESIDLESVNFGFVGLLVPEGDHEIVLQYDPFGWKIGLVLSILGLSILAIYFLMMRKHSKDGKLETQKDL